MPIFIPAGFIKSASTVRNTATLDETTFNALRDYEELCRKLGMSLTFKIALETTHIDVGYLVSENRDFWLLFTSADRSKANFLAIPCSKLDIWSEPIKGSTYFLGAVGRNQKRCPVSQHSYFKVRNNYLDFVTRSSSVLGDSGSTSDSEDDTSTPSTKLSRKLIEDMQNNVGRDRLDDLGL